MADENGAHVAPPPAGAESERRTINQRERMERRISRRLEEQRAQMEAEHAKQVADLKASHAKELQEAQGRAASAEAERRRENSRRVLTDLISRENTIVPLDVALDHWETRIDYDKEGRVVVTKGRDKSALKEPLSVEAAIKEWASDPAIARAPSQVGGSGSRPSQRQATSVDNRDPEVRKAALADAIAKGIL